MNSSRLSFAKLVALAVVAAVAVAAAFRLWLSAPSTDMPLPRLPSACREETFEEQVFIVCNAEREAEIVLALSDDTGKPYGNLAAFARDHRFDFAMNAGMYHEDKSPVGLYVENGRELSPLNTADAAGNFFMKPNGMFFVDMTGKPGILETGAYAASQPPVRYATQSGPMLVIDGAIHPRFEPDGSSRYIRNGVGIDAHGQAVFAISREPVSLGKFARLFRDALGCRNALFFDGAISALHDGQGYLIGGGYPVGPIVAVRPKGAGD